MKSYGIVALVTIILSFSIAIIGEARSRGIQAVSIYCLICSPEKYDGKRLKVFGCMHHRFEDTAIYASKDDGKYLNQSSAIWLNVKKDTLIGEIGHSKDAKADRLHGKYVMVEGTFRMNEHGHGGVFCGALDCNEIKERTVWEP